MPDAPTVLAEQVTGFVQELRQADLYKVTGVSETLDWVAALVALDRQELDAATIERTLGIVLKTQEDMQNIRGERIQQMLTARRRPERGRPVRSRRRKLIAGSRAAAVDPRMRDIRSLRRCQKQVDPLQDRSNRLVRQRPDHGALRRRQSRFLIWSARMTPAIPDPSGMATSNGYPLTRLVTGQSNAKTDPAVVGGRRQNDRGTASGLLPAGLRVQVDPDGVPALGNASGRCHHASPPTQGPSSTSPWEIVLGHTSQKVIQFRSGPLQYRDNQLLTSWSQFDRRVQCDADLGSHGLRNPQRQAVAPLSDACLHAGFSPSLCRGISK